jgi:subtilisin-like proprotein convertase family protein
MFKNIVISLLLLLFIGCGGGDSGGDSPDPTTPIVYTEVNGQLIDGYIKNATVCLDSNLNGLCDSDEKTTLSDDNGNFKFTNIVKSDKFVSLISNGGIDTITNKDFEGQIKTIVNLNDSGKSLVTPITDMIASAFISSTNKNIDTLKDIEIKLANNLNLDISKLHNDPMKDKVVFAKAQEIVSFKAFVKNIADKSSLVNTNTITTQNDNIVSNATSKIFFNKTTNEDTTILKALINMNVEINENNNKSIAYAQDEYSYLKQSIEDTIVNKDIDITKIDRYQRMIQESTRLIKTHIASNNYNYIAQRVQSIDINDIAPTVKNTINDIIVNEDANNTTISIRNIFTDEDNNDSLITKDVVSYDKTLIDIKVNENNITIHFNKDKNGQIPITLEGMSAGQIAQETFNITIKPIDDIPTIKQMAKVYTNENSVKKVTIPANDIDGDSLTYSATSSNDDVHVSIQNNQVVITSTQNWSGDASITVTVNDGTTDVETTFDVTVSNDFDNDFIPNSIEDYLNMDKFKSDENENDEIDGEESTTSISDEFFDKQWHIKSLGNQVNPYSDSLTIEENDLDVMDIYHRYMGYNNGNPIVVQVVDTGVDANHEDLIDNMDLGLSRNSDTKKMGDPVVTGKHGTMCAGIIGARAFNGKGVRGVAPFVKIAGSNWLGYQSYLELEEVWTGNDPDGKIAISSNSWGKTIADQATKYEELMQWGADNLRKINGKAYGKLFIKASGNSRGIRHDSNLQYESSNPYVITVAGLTNENKHASYSTAGSNVFVSGYAGNFYKNSATIATTTVEGNTDLPTWDEDTKKNYTYAMNGTSAATPTVAGSLALVLEACPTLSWRDVRYLIAKTAIKIDTDNTSWHTNSAGFHHSVDYGFGLINPKEMITQCQDNYTPLADSSNESEVFNIDDIAIPDNDSSGISQDFEVTIDKKIEWVGLTVYSDHDRSSDLEINLTSPAGTPTRIMWGKNSGGDNYSLKDGFRYGSVAFIDETSSGTWTLKVADINKSKTGTLTKLKFEVFGH